MRVLSVVSVVLSSLLIVGVANAGSLGVGDKAPALKVAKWVKGKPVTNFEKGKVYVVEFWATWCGPCRQSISHLTELARKYAGKVTFVGVSVWETKDPKDTAYMTKVASFVKEMGDKMGYNVAVDGPEAIMAKTWMDAAEQDGIPAAFVVNGEGKIVWIGHPMGELDQVLSQVLAGKYDVAAAAKKQAQMKALEQGMTKFHELLVTDEAAAYELAAKLAETDAKDHAMALNDLAWSIIDPDAGLEKPDYKVALKIAVRAAEVTQYNDPYILDTLALAYFKTGDVSKAIEYQKKAVDLIEKAGDEIPEATRREIRDRLAQYKQRSG